MINVDALTKTFKNVQALDSLSFQAKDGEITGLLGPNGAGKTTCLRIIYGLLQADTCKAEIEGVDANQNPIDARRNLGIFPDKFCLYERFTVR